MTDAPFDPLLALKKLDEHGIEFVVIGGFAARIWGSPTITNDLDICYARNAANHERLAAVLRELHATLRGVEPGLPFQLDARTIANGDSFTFSTDAGNLDCFALPSGTSGYRDLRDHAEQIDLGDGLQVLFASLDDVIRMKRAAGRRKDLIELEILEALKDERSRRGEH
jgi:hypothetical protein